MRWVKVGGKARTGREGIKKRSHGEAKMRNETEREGEGRTDGEKREEGKGQEK